MKMASWQYQYVVNNVMASIINNGLMAGVCRLSVWRNAISIQYINRRNEGMSAVMAAENMASSGYSIS